MTRQPNAPSGSNPNEGRHVSCESCRKRKAKCSRTPQCSMCTARGVRCTWAPGTGPSRTSEEADLAACEAEVTRLSKLNNQLTLRIQQLEEDLATFSHRELAWISWREDYLRLTQSPTGRPMLRELPPPPPHVIRPFPQHAHTSAISTSPYPSYPMPQDHHRYGYAPITLPPLMSSSASTRLTEVASSPPPRQSPAVTEEQRKGLKRQKKEEAAEARQAERLQDHGDIHKYEDEEDELESDPDLSRYERPVAEGFAQPKPPNKKADAAASHRSSGPIGTKSTTSARKSPITSKTNLTKSPKTCNNRSRRMSVDSEGSIATASSVSTALEDNAHRSLLSLRHAKISPLLPEPELPRLNFQAPSPTTSMAHAHQIAAASEEAAVQNGSSNGPSTSDPWRYRVGASTASKSGRPTSSLSPSGASSALTTSVHTSSERTRHHPYRYSSSSSPPSEETPLFAPPMARSSTGLSSKSDSGMKLSKLSLHQRTPSA